ncbi:MAG: TlpA family protein disulfide reductase [Epsilonproteobacteria bacterium]|nr:TlpA family protein disulfide reductase [Campylobacterota bacterium]
MKKLILLFSLLSLSLYAENFRLETLQQNTIPISNYDGNLMIEDKAYKEKNILLFFFGTQCPYCIKEIPDINELDFENDNLKVIGIHAQHEISDNKLKAFVKKKGFVFEVLAFKDGMKIVEHLIARKMWIGGVPYHILIDKHGNLEPVELSEVLHKL